MAVGEAKSIIIADDHPITRAGLLQVLQELPEWQVIACVADGDAALSQCRVLKPALLILDLMLPVRSGLMVAQALCQASTRPAIIVMSGTGTGQEFDQIRALGVEGLVSKEDPPEEILRAISALQAGQTYCSPAVRALIDPLHDTEDPASPDFHHGLTPRELEVLALVAEGLTNASIGERLGIATRTAKKHRENIRAKLGVNNAVEAARFAVRLGLLKA